MTATGWLHHVTLTTGHSRRSERSEVDAGVLDQLAPVVAEAERHGRAEFPSPAGLMVLTRIADSERPSRHVALWAISEPQGPALVTIALAMQARQGGALWRSLRRFSSLGQPVLVSDPLPPAAPWLAAIVHAAAMTPPHPALEWMGDAERCIAWAWIDGVYQSADA